MQRAIDVQGQTKSATRSTGREPDPEAIRQRAYSIYLARQGAPGSAEDDWVQAERQLRAECGAIGPASLAEIPERPETVVRGGWGAGDGVSKVRREAAAVLFIGG